MPGRHPPAMGRNAFFYKASFGLDGRAGDPRVMRPSAGYICSNHSWILLEAWDDSVFCHKGHKPVYWKEIVNSIRLIFFASIGAEGKIPLDRCFRLPIEPRGGIFILPAKTKIRPRPGREGGDQKWLAYSRGLPPSKSTPRKRGSPAGLRVRRAFLLVEVMYHSPFTPATRNTLAPMNLKRGGSRREGSPQPIRYQLPKNSIEAGV